jgi:hypothetical protein
MTINGDAVCFVCLKQLLKQDMAKLSMKMRKVDLRRLGKNESLVDTIFEVIKAEHPIPVDHSVLLNKMYRRANRSAKIFNDAIDIALSMEAIDKTMRGGRTHYVLGKQAKQFEEQSQSQEPEQTEHTASTEPTELDPWKIIGAKTHSTSAQTEIAQPFEPKSTPAETKAIEETANKLFEQVKAEHPKSLTLTMKRATELSSSLNVLVGQNKITLDQSEDGASIIVGLNEETRSSIEISEV